MPAFFRRGRRRIVAVAPVTSNHREAFKVVAGVYPEVTLFLIDAAGGRSIPSKMRRPMMILPRAASGAPAHAGGGCLCRQVLVVREAPGPEMGSGAAASGQKVKRSAEDEIPSPNGDDSACLSAGLISS